MTTPGRSRMPHCVVIALCSLCLLPMLTRVVEAAPAALGLPGLARQVRRHNSYDCFRLCDSECYHWKGYALKYCGGMCMKYGIDQFTHKFCFNLKKSQGGANRGVRNSDFLGFPLGGGHGLDEIH